MTSMEMELKTDTIVVRETKIKDGRKGEKYGLVTNVEGTDLSAEEIGNYVDKLKHYASMNIGLTFMIELRPELDKNDVLAKRFADCPYNCSLPEHYNRFRK